MDVLDKNEALFKIDEIFKYKNLIDREDREIIKLIINKADDKSIEFYNRFIEIVIDEADHKLNKMEFAELRNELISEMKEYLES